MFSNQEQPSSFQSWDAHFVLISYLVWIFRNLVSVLQSMACRSFIQMHFVACVIIMCYCKPLLIIVGEGFTFPTSLSSPWGSGLQAPRFFDHWLFQTLELLLWARWNRIQVLALPYLSLYGLAFWVCPSCWSHPMTLQLPIHPVDLDASVYLWQNPYHEVKKA